MARINNSLLICFDPVCLYINIFIINNRNINTWFIYLVFQKYQLLLRFCCLKYSITPEHQAPSELGQSLFFFWEYQFSENYYL